MLSRNASAQSRIRSATRLSALTDCEITLGRQSKSAYVCHRSTWTKESRLQSAAVNCRARVFFFFLFFVFFSKREAQRIKSRNNCRERNRRRGTAEENKYGAVKRTTTTTTTTTWRYEVGGKRDERSVTSSSGVA